MAKSEAVKLATKMRNSKDFNNVVVRGNHLTHIVAFNYKGKTGFEVRFMNLGARVGLWHNKNGIATLRNTTLHIDDNSFSISLEDVRNAIHLP